MSPSNSPGHGSVTDDLATTDSYEQNEAAKEALKRRMLELDRQIQALDNETADDTSASGGSPDGDAGSSSLYAAADGNSSSLPTSSEPLPTHPQVFRPPPLPPQSAAFSAPTPTTDDSAGGLSYPQRQQGLRQHLASTGGGGNVYAQHSVPRPPDATRVPSTASVGSGSTGSNHRLRTDSFPYSNSYDPQFLAAAASAFHQQLQHQQASIASVNSGTSQQLTQKESTEDNSNTSILWKLLQDKEDELKEVRQTLRETQQKFQEQSLLATKLQTTLDQVQESFEKERMLIKLQAEKEAQESLACRQEELYQKQLKWMENTVVEKHNSNSSQSQKTSASFGSNDNSTNTEKAKPNGAKANQQVEVAAKKNGEAATTKSPTAKASIDKDSVAKENANAKNESSNKFKIPSNSNSKIPLYPSVDETLNGTYKNEDNIASGKNKKNTTNESLSSDRFDPVYVAQTAAIDESTAKESSYFSNDDDRSLGQTVASSTYGDDRVKVVNKKLLDPYGDKGTYTGVVLRNTGMPHGLGRMVYEEDRRVFEGDWRHGRWHGYGRASFSNGDSYEGEYKFDQRHGTGVYRWNDGRVYDGHFSEDKRHGKGIFTWPDGAVYDGDFVNGQRQGHGKYTFADGGQYEGSWKDGRYDGFGTCTWEDGRRYRGEWRNGMAHGRGTETYPNGSIRHEGEWIDDEPIR